MNQGLFVDSETRFLVTDRFYVDRGSESLMVEGEAVPLHRRNYQVLLELMSRPNELVTKRELFENVWGTLDVSDAVLTTAIKELRQALGDDARDPWAIATVHARGYRFLLDVKRSATSVLQPPAPENIFEENKKTPIGWIAGIVAILAVVIIFLLVSGPSPDEEATNTISRSIAVLPFDDLSAEGNLKWFGDGLAEEILNSLARSGDLMVSARTSSFRYGNDNDIREIGRDLDVSYVMEGSVRRDARQLRVTAQIIRANDGFHVWSETYDLPIDTSNALSLQRNIAQDVLATFESVSTENIVADHASEVPLEVYEQYVRGRQLVMSRREEGVLEGLQELNSVVRLAPDFAPGHAWLAYAYLFSTQFSGRPMMESATAAEVHVRRAIELEPEGADPLTAAALLELFRRDFTRALDYADRAVTANPNHVPALRRRGVILLGMGNIPEASRDFMAVAARDPLSPISLGHVADIHWILGEKDRALASARENVRWNPGDAIANGTLGRILADAGEYGDAIARLEAAVEINPNMALSTLTLAALYWKVGLDEMISFAEPAMVWNGMAAAALSAGDFDRGLQLVQAYGMGSTGSLSGIEIYHWHGDMEIAYPLAMRIAEQDLVASSGLEYAYVRSAIPALMILEANGAPQAVSIRNKLAVLFSDKKPGDLAFASSVYGAASWHMLNGRPEEALAWLQDAIDKGFIFRALHLDPIWDSLRETMEFQGLVQRSDLLAESVREQYLSSS